MLFDLDKARRHFDEDVRFAVEGSVDKKTLDKAVIDVFMNGNMLKASPYPITAKECVVPVIQRGIEKERQKPHWQPPMHGTISHSEWEYQNYWVDYMYNRYIKKYADDYSLREPGAIIGEIARKTGIIVSKDEVMKACKRFQRAFLKAGKEELARLEKTGINRQRR